MALLVWRSMDIFSSYRNVDESQSKTRVVSPARVKFKVYNHLRDLEKI